MRWCGSWVIGNGLAEEERAKSLLGWKRKGICFGAQTGTFEVEVVVFQCCVRERSCICREHYGYPQKVVLLYIISTGFDRVA